MRFVNFAVSFFSSNRQQIVTGVPPEAHQRLIFRLDEVLEKLSLTEEEKTEALVELAKSKGDLESIVKIVTGFLQAIYREDVPPDQFAATFFKLVVEWRTAGARIDAIGTSRNLTPQIASLREKARVAY
jgi:hypothetical protein